MKNRFFFAPTCSFFSFVRLFDAAQVLCTARCALHLHSVKYRARHQDGANPVGTTKSVRAILPMLCALRRCVSVLLGSPLGRVLWARLPKQKLQLGFENHFETLAGFLH